MDGKQHAHTYVYQQVWMCLTQKATEAWRRTHLYVAGATHDTYGRWVQINTWLRLPYEACEQDTHKGHMSENIHNTYTQHTATYRRSESLMVCKGEAELLSKRRALSASKEAVPCVCAVAARYSA